jgi:hypothetical protein
MLATTAAFANEVRPAGSPRAASEPSAAQAQNQGSTHSGEVAAPQENCRTVRRSESRLRSRQERVCTPAHTPSAPAAHALTADAPAQPESQLPTEPQPEQPLQPQ